MTDYTELVKKLRNRRVCIQSGGNGDDFRIWSDAADAIEELEKKMLNWQATADDHWEAYQHWFHKYMDDVPKWIPVTERLPNEDGWYQVYAPGYSGGSSSGLKNINGNMYSDYKHGKWSIEVGYHKRPGCVKAWMPLPTPPKEEHSPVYESLKRGLKQAINGETREEETE